MCARLEIGLRMTGLVAQFASSFGAVAALVALAHLLGFSAGARLTSEEEARELLRLAPGGFEPLALSLERDGRGAIARDSTGRIALLLPHGGQFVARVLVPAPWLKACGDALAIECAALGPRAITLLLGESAADWASRSRDAS